jgi:hypothetical protein
VSLNPLEFALFDPDSLAAVELESEQDTKRIDKRTMTNRFMVTKIFILAVEEKFK